MKTLCIPEKDKSYALSPTEGQTLGRMRARPQMGMWFLRLEGPMISSLA